MALIVDRTDDRSEPTTRDEGTALEFDPQRRRIDVTDLHAAGIEEFVESSVDADDVSLEHRLDRTYLVIEE